MPSHSWDVLTRLPLAVPKTKAALADARADDDPIALAAPAASVVLVREAPGGLQVYLQHRHSRMPFAASMAVFPGGRVDPADAVVAAEAFGAKQPAEGTARAGGPGVIDQFRACAVRETLEETGVRLRADDLVPWAHWITPHIEPLRYDTHFFLAALPAGEEPQDISGETERADWSTPQEALTAAERGELALMPPTRSVLLELADAVSVAELQAVAADRVIEPVLPRLQGAEDGWSYVYPHRPSDAASGLRMILAPNPGPMTLDGTNTWIVGDSRRGRPIVVDPGPLNEDHLTAIMTACGGGISTIVLSHRHADHAEAAAELAARAGCGVRAADPRLQIGPDGLADGDVLEAAGARLQVRTTPGHTSDSISLLCTGTDGVNRVLTGDMVLGRGTTVITHPDGDLQAYFDSLQLLVELVRAHDVVELLPGHGPRVPDPLGWLNYYRRHREERLDQVRAALAGGDRTPAEVVARVYADVDRSLWPAAEQSVRAQLAYLAPEGASSADV
jgi:glyoxylase-like metal-dependent hydrolase (beta-lactamase superfamily II)/8-oxo-dGTP pyrophosphatase MutT (NUDIX family)